MNHRFICVLLGILFVSSTLSGAVEKPAADSQKAAAETKTDARAILDAGRAVHALPAGMIVRVHAHLIRVASATRRHVAGPEKTFLESWEFSGDLVHRVTETPSDNGEGLVRRHVESLPIDSSGICKELLDGKILTIGEAEKGEGQNFIDTEYDVGSRSIEIVMNGKSVLYVGESCVVAGYVESDARAFGLLYEKLAKKARGVFEERSTPHAAPSKCVD